MAGELVWGFRRPYFRFDPQPYAQADLLRGLNHSTLGCSGSGAWVTAVLEWEPGSDTVGDFTVITGAVATKRTVADQLVVDFSGLAIGPVEFWQHPKLDKVKRPRKPRVLLPYRGPALCYLYATHDVPLDLERSTVKVTRDPDGTVIRISDFEGLERFELKGVFPNLSAVRIPRKPGAGLFFHERDLRGTDFWRPANVHMWGHPSIYCRDRVKRFIEEAGYTNVKFLEVGEIVDD